MSVRRKDILNFITNIIGNNLDIDKTENFIISLFDLNNREVLDFDKEETYVFRKRLGILDDGVVKSCEEIGVDMKRPLLEVQKLELNAFKKIKKNLDISYKNILISNLNFSVKAFGCLKAKSINTLGELLDKSIEELNKICYMNKQTLLEIINKVHEMGYLFRDEFDFGIKKDIYFNDEYIVSNLDNGREIYNFEYMNNSLLICSVDSKTMVRTYIFDDNVLTNVYLEELLKKISSFILINDEGTKKIENAFKQYIESIQISKKNKIQNIVRKEILNNIKYKEDDFDLLVGFYDYLKGLYSDKLINVFRNYLKFDKVRVSNLDEYYNLVNFYVRVIKFLEVEKYEIENDSNSINKERLKDIDKYKKLILEEKNSLLSNMSENYLKYVCDDDFINASSDIVNKLFLDISLSFENNNDSISMSEVFCEIDPEYVEREFFNLFNPIEGNMEIPFIVKFNDVVLKYCSKDEGIKYTEKEVIDFLINKYVVYTMGEANSINTLIEYINNEVSGKLRQ